MHHAQTATHFEGPCGAFRRTRGQRIAHGFLWGSMIVTAGILFLLEHLGYLGGYAAWSFWPLLLVTAGLDRMLIRRSGKLFGVALAVAGGLLLVWSLALAPIQWGLVWPILIIGFGLILMIRVFTRKRRHVPPFARDLPPDKVVMGSKVEKVDSQEWDGGEVSTVMGAYQIDLRGAEMKGERATLYAKAVMGAVEVIVPYHWRVEVKSNPVLGGIENKCREAVDAEKTLEIQADVVLGGIEIRN